MRKMSENQIQKAISNVTATLAVEGLKASKVTITYGRKFFNDEISIDEAVKLTTKRILLKKERLVRS